MSVFARVHMPALDGATEWLNSEPLGAAELRGHVVLVNFWTLTCINWLRQEPYVREWSRAYRDDGLIVIGVHTPEFSFEHDIDGVRRATEERAIDYPVVVDNDYEVWSAFANRYSAALYFADRQGVIRDQHFGEGRYEKLERIIQQLLGSSASPSSSVWRRRPTGTTSARPRPTSATRAAASSGLRQAWSWIAVASTPPGGPAPRPWGPCRPVGDQARVRRPRPGRREHRLPVPRA
jgi:thiol-disulfide isomerase/thioredoxin